MIEPKIVNKDKSDWFLSCEYFFNTTDFHEKIGNMDRIGSKTIIVILSVALVAR